MIKQLALSLMILGILGSGCQNGCLRCEEHSSTNPEKICVLCDSLNSYYMQADHTCAKTNITNCRLLSNANVCLACMDEYFLSNGKCEPVD